MEKKVLREAQKRIVKTFLDVLILDHLRKEPKSAYDVIVFIYKESDFLISQGIVYATLYSMERDGLVQNSLDKGKRVYTITEKGKKTLQLFRKASKRGQLFPADFLAYPNE